ncbi:hypothetical protein AXE65_08340 [Ventosimonas gracilis]|uniref:Uncharacterized protein n=1 Tax=Ventosimonas gracilis TaxID=1680762 RepID=A0A139SYJ4_9GAMM|nr:hypothetical protein [Ventosimonas gracilis]KXU39501.1 hypothetical protein AXE65_08340 [Ventosimonas gracilis]
MSTATLEIVELNDGRIALRYVEKDEILLALSFSGKTINFLRGQHREIARAMIDTGVQMAAQVLGHQPADNDDENIPHVLH